jgi:hypothetical protein
MSFVTASGKEKEQKKRETRDLLSPDEDRANTETGISCANESRQKPKKTMNANNATKKPKS